MLTIYINWLVVSQFQTPLKNMKVSWGLLFPIYGTLQNVPNHQPAWNSYTASVLYKNSLYKNLRGSNPRRATYFQLY